MDSNYSKLLIVGNKRDLVADEDIERIKNDLNFSEFEEISLNSPDAKSQLQALIKDVLGLKKELPKNFKELVKEAENLFNVGNIVHALTKYRELVKIVTFYQDFEHVNLFQQKVRELSTKLKEQKELRKELAKEMKFEIPRELKFKKKIKVKPLPTTAPTVEPVSQKESEEEIIPPSAKSVSEMVSFQKLETKPSGLKLIKPSEIPSKPVKPVIFTKSEDEKTKKSELKMPMELFPPHEELAKEIKKPKISDFAKEVQKIISEKGSSLSLKLCEQLVTDLEQSLGRPLTIEDIKVAANFFVKQEQLV